MFAGFRKKEPERNVSIMRASRSRCGCRARSFSFLQQLSAMVPAVMATAAAAAALHLPSLGGMSPAPGRALQESTSAGTFSCSPSIASTVSGVWKFQGAATTPSGVVVFAPHCAN